jgi:hypothetical protein
VRRALGLVLIALAGASVILYVWVPFSNRHPRKADAIVVLAGSKTRLPVGLDLFHDGVAPVLLISEDGNDKRRVAYCRLPAKGALCFRANPYSTQGEAEAVARLARRHGWHSLAIVSSRFHLFRVRMLFRRCTNARLQLVPAHVEWWLWPTAIPSEWAKLGVALTTRRGC